jgi:hypothetical protein
MSRSEILKRIRQARIAQQEAEAMDFAKVHGLIVVDVPPRARRNASWAPWTAGKEGVMRRLLFTGVCVTLVLLSLRSAATPAMASTSVPVTIRSTVIIGPFTGTWSASGGISDSGTLVEPSVRGTGQAELHIVRDVTGSLGTFTLRIESKAVAVEPDGSVDFTGLWVIQSGTGAYADLHGVGTRNAVANFNSGVVTETLTGSVHYD